jgi:hypothetical protein
MYNSAARSSARSNTTYILQAYAFISSTQSYLRQVSDLTPNTTSHCYSCEMRTVIGLTRLTFRSDTLRICKKQALGCAGTGLEINRVSRFIVAYAWWCYTRGVWQRLLHPPPHLFAFPRHDPAPAHSRVQTYHLAHTAPSSLTPKW